jgi:hypothetical protein
MPMSLCRLPVMLGVARETTFSMATASSSSSKAAAVSAFKADSKARRATIGEPKYTLFSAWLSTYAEARGSDTQFLLYTYTLLSMFEHVRTPTSTPSLDSIIQQILLSTRRIPQRAANMPKVVRLTLFKIGDKDAIQQTITKYGTLAQDATKVR